MKVYAHRVDAMTYDKETTATPFRPTGDGFAFRDETLASGIEAVTTLAEAEVAALPAEWGAYRGDARRDAIGFIEHAATQGLRVGVWAFGDDEVDLPWANVVQFQHAFRRSRRVSAQRVVLPSFFSDFVGEVFGTDFRTLAKGPRPLVGFCGQARSGPTEEAKRLLLKGRARLLRASRRSDAVPEPWGSHVRLRRRALDALAADSRVDTDFVIRDRYHAGLTDPADAANSFHAVNLAFLRNVHDTQYTVCVRGGGNYSVRLFETLCIGRVPIVVDSDGLLPWPDDPFWREVALVVPEADLASLADRVVAHHAAADEDGWTERQQRARRFWFDRMAREGWLDHLPELLHP